MSIKLVTGDSGSVRDRIALLQMALAAELSGGEVQVVSEDNQTAEYPAPRLVTAGGKVLFAPISAACSLLLTDDCALVEVFSEAENIVRDIVQGRGLDHTPSNVIAQIAAFSALHVTGARSEKFADDFGKKEQVLRVLSKIDVALVPKRCIREGVAHSFDRSLKTIAKDGERNVLITAALPYVNNVPHLGNIIGCLLSADVFARYCRLRDYNIIYVCGTDEYGTATETKALEEGLTCEEVCGKYFRVHASIYDWFQIDCDIFGRTSTEHQTAITHDIFHRLYSNGYFFEQAIEQTFCEQCSRFLADRYVEGTCPLCGFHDARGDQCDGCGKLINPVDLVNPKCKMCKSCPIVKSSQHLFLDLSRLQPSCEQFVDESSAKGKWSSNSAAISKAWLAEGLKPRCMTRDMKWGTSVPVAGFENKVFYVWFDAPIGYLSITANYTPDWERWWKNPDNVQLYQFMGKDNVPFHAVIFPSTLIGTGVPFTLVHHISTTEFLNYESGKFSKSRGTGVFGNDARDSGIPATLWRYYLLATRPETNDSVFTWDDFAAKVNSELLANFGNFINRTCKFLHSKFDGRLEETLLCEGDERLMANVNEELQQYLQCMEVVKLRAALKAVLAVSAAGNAYLQDNKLDNRLLANDRPRCATVVGIAANLCYLLSAMVAPFLPECARDICCILNAPERKMPAAFELDLLPGHVIGVPFLLFHKLDESLVKEQRTKYAGKQ